MLADGGFSLEGDGAKHAPPGLFGGEDGTPGAVVLNAGTDGELELPSKFPYRKATTGDRLMLIAPSGGGYGDPGKRDPAAEAEDRLTASSRQISRDQRHGYCPPGRSD